MLEWLTADVAISLVGLLGVLGTALVAHYSSRNRLLMEADKRQTLHEEKLHELNARERERMRRSWARQLERMGAENNDLRLQHLSCQAALDRERLERKAHEAELTRQIEALQRRLAMLIERLDKCEGDRA